MSHENTDFPQERRNKIYDKLKRDGRVTIREIVQDYAVSEDTIRRDLKELQDAGLCTCVYGGALVSNAAVLNVGQRRGQDVGRKDQLGKILGGLVKPGQVVFLDAGTTNLAAAQHIPDREDITVITHDPAIAAALILSEHIKLISIGGQINRSVGAALDASAMRSIKSVHPDLLILGSCAADGGQGLSAFTYEDAEIKSVLVQNAREVATGILNEKLGARAPYAICPLDAVSTLVLEADAPEAVLRKFASKSLNMIIAKTAL